MNTLAAHFLLFAIVAGLAPEAKFSTLLHALTGSALLYSSADGGKTWQPITITGAPNAATEDAFAVDPQNSSNLYVALNGAVKSPSGIASGIFRSADGGASNKSRPLGQTTSRPSGHHIGVIGGHQSISNVLHNHLQARRYRGFERRVPARDEID